MAFTSCSKDEYERELKLDQDRISIWIGQQDSIKIFSGPTSLVVEADDRTIASAIIKGHTIIIKGTKPGKTILHLKDNSKCLKSINVFVSTFSGYWEEVEVPQKYLFEAIVEANDKELAEELRQQLWKSAVLLIRTVYDFHSESDELEVKMRDGSRVKGTYHFDNENLTMNFNNNIQLYKVGYLGSTKIVELTQDLTEIYKTQYPEAGISKVLVRRYIAKPLYL